MKFGKRKIAILAAWVFLVSPLAAQDTPIEAGGGWPEEARQFDFWLGV